MTLLGAVLVLLLLVFAAVLAFRIGRASAPAPTPVFETTDQLLERLSNLDGEGLEIAVDYVRRSAEDEEVRRKVLDNKGTILVSALAIAAAFAVQAAGLLRDTQVMLAVPMRAAITTTYLFTLVAFAIALARGIRALSVRSWWAAPDADGVLEFGTHTPDVIRREIVAMTLSAWRRNTETNDRRADDLHAGQIALVAAALGLLALGALAALAVTLG